MDRQQNETMQQYRGRQKREMNAANDALNLTVGEPIRIGKVTERFHVGLIERTRPTRITRLEGNDLTAFLTKEMEWQKERKRRDLQQAEIAAFCSRNEVQDADAIRHILEDRLKLVVDRLTPQEWAEFRKRLEA